MRPYIKDLLIIALILLCFLIGCHWDKSSPRIETQTVYVKGETIIKVDTFYRDTTIYKPVATLVYVGDSSRHVDCDSIREYTTSQDDSSGLVVVESKVQGELIDQKITLQSYVTSTLRVDTLRITNNIIQEKALFAPFLRIENSATPLSGGVIWGNSRTIYGLSYAGKTNFGFVFGYNLAKK
jgi:hypothetical protein